MRKNKVGCACATMVPSHRTGVCADAARVVAGLNVAAGVQLLQSILMVALDHSRTNTPDPRDVSLHTCTGEQRRVAGPRIGPRWDLSAGLERGASQTNTRATSASHGRDTQTLPHARHSNRRLSQAPTPAPSPLVYLVHPPTHSNTQNTHARTRHPALATIFMQGTTDDRLSELQAGRVLASSTGTP